MNLEQTGAGTSSTESVERGDFEKAEVRLNEIKGMHLGDMSDDDHENVMAERKALRAQKEEIMGSAQDQAMAENQERSNAEKITANADEVAKAEAETVAQAEKEKQIEKRKQEEATQIEALTAEIKGVSVEKKEAETMDETSAMNAMVEAARAYRNGGGVDRTQYDATWKNIPDSIKTAPGFSERVSSAMEADKAERVVAQEDTQEKIVEPEENVIEAVENKLEFTIPVLDRDLMELGVNPEKRAEFLDELKNFSPEKTIDLYHGLNGGIEGALKVLESPEQGVKQISGPCLSVYPIGQFWKPGGAGLKYSVPRGDIEFPGESKPNAQFRMDDEGVIFLVNGLDTLSLNKFDGEVMRTVATEEVYEKDEDGFNKAESVNGEWVDFPPVNKEVALTDEETKLERRIQEKLKELSNTRKKNNHQ